MQKLKSSTLRLEALNKFYGDLQVVCDVDLQIRAGSLLTLLGPSGCGKTTVLRMIAGFANISSGKVLVDSVDVSNLEPHHRDTGMVFQNYALFPHMRVEENVAFGLRMRRVPKVEQQTRVAEVLDLVRLTSLAQRYPSELSGGQQQRVALARALVIRPKLLLLDEPLGALDRHLREGLQEELRNLQQKLGVTTVLVTHDQEEALYLSDYVAVMNTGRIEQLGPPLDLYDCPRTEFVARFLGIPNILEAELCSAGSDESWISISGTKIPAAHSPNVTTGSRVLVSVRPSHIEITTSDDPRHGIPAHVILTKELGERLVYHVDVVGNRIEAHTSRLRSVRRHPAGSNVKLVFDPAHTILLEG